MCVGGGGGSIRCVKGCERVLLRIVEGLKKNGDI